MIAYNRTINQNLKKNSGLPGKICNTPSRFNPTFESFPAPGTLFLLIQYSDIMVLRGTAFITQRYPVKPATYPD